MLIVKERFEMSSPHRNTRRFYLLAIVALLCVSALFVWSRGWIPGTNRAGGVYGTYVDWTKAAIIEKLGEPEHRWAGHYGNPPVSWAQQFDPCETFMYTISGGTLYVSVYQIDGQWVCFSSDWLPKGTVF